MSSRIPLTDDFFDKRLDHEEAMHVPSGVTPPMPVIIELS